MESIKAAGINQRSLWIRFVNTLRVLDACALTYETVEQPQRFHAHAAQMAFQNGGAASFLGRFLPAAFFSLKRAWLDLRCYRGLQLSLKSTPFQEVKKY